MANNGSMNKTMDGLNTKSVAIPAGYTSGGTVSVDNTVNNIAIDQADLIAQIQTALNGKASASLPTLTNEGSAADLLSGKQLISSSGSVVTGTIATKTSSNLSASGATVTVPAGYYASNASKSVSTAIQATPIISVGPSSGLIIATATQTDGYVSAGTKSATQQLTVQAAQTITPGTSDKTIASGRYLTGTQTIKGDANLIAANIASGVSIFGVTGTHSGGGEDVTSETNTYTSLLTDLRSAVNDLPDAGSGGGSGGGNLEMCKVTVKVNAPSPAPFTAYHYNENLEVVSSIIDDMIGGTFSTVKGSLIFINPWHNMTTGIGSGDATGISRGSQGGIYIINSDCSLTYDG